MVKMLYSEKTKKYYKEDEYDKLVADEEAYDKAIKAEEDKKNQRAERAKEVEESFKKAEEVYEEYKKTIAQARKLRSDFIKDYGNFHMTIKKTGDFNDSNAAGVNVFDLLFDPWSALLGA